METLKLSKPKTQVFSKCPDTNKCYFFIQYLVRKNTMDETVFSADVISYYTGIKDVRKPIANLIKQGYVERINNRYLYKARKESFWFETGYIYITEKELLAIKNPKLLLFYCKLLTTLDYTIVISGINNFLGHMSRGYIAKVTGVSENTVTNYMRELSRLGVLYVVPRYMNTTLYGRVEHKTLIDLNANM